MLVVVFVNFMVKLNECNDISFKNIYSINIDDCMIQCMGNVILLEKNFMFICLNVVWMIQNDIYFGQFLGDYIVKLGKFKINWLIFYSYIFCNILSFNCFSYFCYLIVFDLNDLNLMDMVWIVNILLFFVGLSYGGGMFFFIICENSKIGCLDFMYLFGKGIIKIDIKFGGFVQICDCDFIV